MKTSPRLLLLPLLFHPLLPQAATFYRCLDAQGRTLFSQTQCAEGAESAELRPAQAVAMGPQDRGAEQQLRAMQQLSRSQPPSKAKPKASKPDECPWLDSTKRRNLLVGKELFKCMTKEEAAAVMGAEPEQRSRDASGQERWYYRYDDGASTKLAFDADGLLRDWTKGSARRKRGQR